jgi:hypothetical protein
MHSSAAQVDLRPHQPTPVTAAFNTPANIACLVQTMSETSPRPADQQFLVPPEPAGGDSNDPMHAPAASNACSSRTTMCAADSHIAPSESCKQQGP